MNDATRPGGNRLLAGLPSAELEALRPDLLLVEQLAIETRFRGGGWQRPDWMGRRAGVCGGAAVARQVWTYVGGRAGNKPPPAEQAAITAACETLVAEVLRPRFLPEIRRSAAFNYPVAIGGKWHGNNTGSSRATARMIPLPWQRSSMRPLPGWTTSAGTVSIWRGTGTLANGFACSSACP